ncbi:MAG: uracil-DNA glycosylase [Acidobacteria bacterium]|nr:uracil-DNA glycosylase [Acidobacteriota bacterium]
MTAEEKLLVLNRRVVRCRRCPRLVRYRERVAREKRRAFREWEYWGRPVPGFGDPEAELLVLGLAPAAHGGNRTGRVFTGDRSGDFLYARLYEAGFANQPRSVSRDDGLALRNCYVTASVRCCPPENKPTRQEQDNCRLYLIEELRLLGKLRAVLALGRLAFDTYLDALEDCGRLDLRRGLKFAHGASYDLPAVVPAAGAALRLGSGQAGLGGRGSGRHVRLFACYHPS